MIQHFNHIFLICTEAIILYLLLFTPIALSKKAFYCKIISRPSVVQLLTKELPTIENTPGNLGRFRGCSQIRGRSQCSFSFFLILYKC